MASMPRLKFLLWTTGGATIWNSVLAGAGLFLGTRFRELDRVVGPVVIAVFVLMAAGYLYRVATWQRSRRAS
jgi:membrane protein DedA with SNARE-associated domain